MKFGIRESIAVAIAIIIVFGFFFVFNRNAPIDIVENLPENNEASPLPGFEELVKQGNTELVVEDLTIGSGQIAEVGDALTVHYVGILTDGTQFDSSISRGQPFTFTLGTGTVIKGWDQGLVGMKEGGRRVLIIPAHLAYGNRGTGSIPPNATLIFEVLLLEVNQGAN